MTMRTFELRVYTLRTKEAFDFYVNRVHPRHLSSFQRFGIEAHGIWTAKEDSGRRAFLLVSYAAGEDPGEVVRRYIQSAEFAEEITGWDVSNIVGVESTILIPTTSS